MGINLNKRAREYILKIINQLDERESKKAKLFLKDLLGATYNWEKKIYKNRLLTLLCKNIKKKDDVNNKTICKEIKKYLDELG